MDRPFSAYKGSEPYVFVCYAHGDSRIVYPEIHWLHQQGIHVWYDEGIAAGTVWRAEVADSIQRATQVIFYISAASLASANCKREIDYALDQGIDVVPVFLDATALPPALDLALNGIHALRRSDDANYRAHLLDALHRPRSGIPPAVAPPQRRWRVLGSFLAAIVIATIAAGVWFWRTAPTPDRSPIRSLAVLPLTDLAQEKETYFADGMTETLIAELAKLPGIRVTSRTSVMEYKGKAMPVREIAKQLNVDGIIEGSVMRDSGQVRITAQLIDARDDRHLWAEHYDRDAAHVFEIQAEVAKTVARQIALTLTPQQQAQRFVQQKPVDPRAQEAYFRGLQYRAGELNVANVDKASAAFEEAIQIAPDFAAAYAQLAATLWNTGDVPDGSHDVPVATMLRIRDLARRAIELDESNGGAHSVLGDVLFHYDWDWTAAEAEYRRAQDLGNTVNYGYPYFLISMGRAKEALVLVEALPEDGPSDLLVKRLLLADIYLFGLRQYERGVEVTQAMLDHFVRSARSSFSQVSRRAIMSIVSGITQVEQRALLTAVERARIRNTDLVEEGLAAESERAGELAALRRGHMDRSAAKPRAAGFRGQSVSRSMKLDAPAQT